MGLPGLEPVRIIYFKFNGNATEISCFLIPYTAPIAGLLQPAIGLSLAKLLRRYNKRGLSPPVALSGRSLGLIINYSHYFMQLNVCRAHTVRS